MDLVVFAFVKSSLYLNNQLYINYFLNNYLKYAGLNLCESPTGYFGPGTNHVSEDGNTGLELLIENFSPSFVIIGVNVYLPGAIAVFGLS